MAKELCGIAVYKIKEDGCLNGTWTNNATPGMVMNECARKTDKERMCIAGNYSVTFIEETGSIINGKLVIERIGETFSFEWTIENDTAPKFKGVGLKSGNKHISVGYWVIQ
jgi:hypothetical protein